MRKLLSLLLATVMVLSIVPAVAFTSSATDFTSLNLSVNKDFKAGAKMDPYVMQKSTGGLGTGFVLNPNWTTEFIGVQENTSSQTGAVVSDKASFPEPTNDHFYYVTYGLQAKTDYYFRTDGTYKVDDIDLTYAEPSNLNSVKVAENLKPNQFAAFTTIVGGKTISKLFFKVRYNRVMLDGKFYGVILGGAQATIKGDTTKGHIKTCSWSGMTGGGSISSSNISCYSITLAKTMTNPTGNYINLYPTYEKHNETVEVTKAATETEEGTAKATCSVTNNETTKKIPKNGSVAFNVTMPKEGDNAEYMPEISGYTSTFVFVDEDPSWLDYTGGGLPYATGKFTVGRKYKALVSFKPTSDYFIPKTSYEITVNGEKVTADYYKTKDQHFFYVDYLPTEHTWEFKDTVAPTCVAEGSNNYVCKYCTATKSEPIPATQEHDYYIYDYETDVFAATLTKQGSILYTCKGCGDTYTKTISPVTDIRLKHTSLVYTGSTRKPGVIVEDAAGEAVPKDLYTLTYSNKSSKAPGKYTVTVKAGDDEDQRAGWFYYFSKTLTYTIKPRQVTGLKASKVAKNSITLAWTKLTEAKYYKIEQSTNGTSWSRVAVVSGTSYTVKNLKAGAKYQFRVKALDSTKKIGGKVSTVLRTGTLTEAPKITKISSTKAKTATITWGKVTGAKSYTVYKSTDGKNFTKVKSGITKLTYTFTGLAAGKKIYLKVVAVNAYGKASASSGIKYIYVKK